MKRLYRTFLLRCVAGAFSVHKNWKCGKYYGFNMFQNDKLNTGINYVTNRFIMQPPTDNIITRFTHWDFCIYKIGRIVTVLVNFSGDMEPTPGTAYKLLTIPEAYRPIVNMIETFPTQINGITVMASINPDGSFTLFNDGVKITSDWICRKVFTYISKQ